MDTKLILIAEDEVACRKILQDGLQKEGYEVGIAVNGEDLLKIARVKKPVLIILDLLMPVKNGFQVLSEIKNDENLKNIKVVVLSNLSQAEDIEKVKKLGADAYMVKSDETFYNVIHKIKNILT